MGRKRCNVILNLIQMKTLKTAKKRCSDTSAGCRPIDSGRDEEAVRLPRQIVVLMAFLMTAPSRAPGLSERPPSPRPPSRRMRGCFSNVDWHLKGVSHVTE